MNIKSTILFFNAHIVFMRLHKQYEQDNYA